MKNIIISILILWAPLSARAGTYMAQSTFSVTGATIAAVDRDSAGNLYLLSLNPATSTYWVASYRTPALAPVFTFNTGARNPRAFAVEPSGTVDVLDGSAQFILRRFTNTGFLLSQATYTVNNPFISTSSVLAAAVDGRNERVYLTYNQYVTWYCVQQVGSSCAPSGWHGFVDVYDFAGNWIKTVQLPGSSSTNGCYNPRAVAGDPAGGFGVFDPQCLHLMRFSASLEFESDRAVSQVTGSLTGRSMWFDEESSVYIGGWRSFAGPSGYEIVKVSEAGSVIASAYADAPAGVPWDGRTLYLALTGSSKVVRHIYNDSPTVPAVAGPFGQVVQHSSAATVRWQASSDPNGDSLLYTVSLGTTPFSLEAVGVTSAAEFITAPLSFGTTYYWRVSVHDSYLGLPLPSRASPVSNFVLGLVNTAPSAFTVLAGTGTVSTREPSTIFSWSPAHDADGDVPNYEFSWREADGALSVVITTGTAVQLNGLSFGSTYYWSVRASDSYGASSTLSSGAVQAVALSFRNAAPSTPVYVSTTAIVTRAPAYELAWTEAEDHDGDRVDYRVYLSTVPGIERLVQSGPRTSYELPLTYGTTIFWRVEAVDGFGGVSDAGTRTFVATFLNDPPEQVRLVAPFIGSPTVKTMQGGVEVSWERVANPQDDPITYTAWLGSSPQELRAVARVDQPSGLGALRASQLAPRPTAEAVEDGSQLRLRLSGLDFYRTYYLKVQAATPYGASSQTPLQAFTLTPSDGFPKTYNYPNPFSSSRGGTNIVFNAPPSGFQRAIVKIYSEFGQLLAKREYGPIPQGISQVAFDGRDANGRPLPNGSYVGRVEFDAPNDTATFYLMVVR